MNGPLSERLAFNFFNQMLQAIKYCHDRNIVHRDLKVNLLLI
jgi:serine/threonine protein kinase